MFFVEVLCESDSELRGHHLASVQVVRFKFPGRVKFFIAYHASDSDVLVFIAKQRSVYVTLTESSVGTRL